MSTVPTPTTELEAVNTMLGTIGESPVNTLGGDTNVDVALARQILTEVMKAVQAEGWHFNTEEDYPLVPDVDGHITLPNNTIRVDADTETDIDIVVRGTQLYDKKNHTNEFERTIYVEITWFLAFNEMPHSARSYIAVRAARIFQDRVQGSEAKHIFNVEDEKTARALMEREESLTGDANILNNYWAYNTVHRNRRVIQ